MSLSHLVCLYSLTDSFVIRSFHLRVDHICTVLSANISFFVRKHSSMVLRYSHMSLSNYYAILKKIHFFITKPFFDFYIIEFSYILNANYSWIGSTVSNWAHYFALHHEEVKSILINGQWIIIVTKSHQVFPTSVMDGFAVRRLLHSAIECWVIPSVQKDLIWHRSLCSISSFNKWKMWLYLFVIFSKRPLSTSR